MALKRTKATVFAICICMCFVFYQIIGNKWLLLHLLTKPEIGGNNSSTFFLDSTKHNGRETIYSERRRTILKGCETIKRNITNKIHNLVFDEKHFIYYCPIAKVGSTFWKRVLTVMASEGRLKSPFQISFKHIVLNKISESDERILKGKVNSFLFVRDPYTRIFSGYESKIYNSNLMFWRSVGRKVVRVVRRSNESIYKNHGFDVTFPEFIKYILYLNESGKRIDGHFSPMADHCDPCSTYFHYIGKIETITEDAAYLISKWKRQFNDFSLHFNDFEKETVLDTARGHVRLLFETKKVLKEIQFPFIKLMLRTWRDLQIRGFLSRYIEFPFKDSDADNIKKEDYVEAIKKALSIPVNRRDVKHQRDEAIIQAYRHVQMEDMEKLRLYLLKDCLLFGYDDRPAKLFDRTHSFNEKFLYLDGLKRD